MPTSAPINYDGDMSGADLLAVEPDQGGMGSHDMVTSAPSSSGSGSGGSGGGGAAAGISIIGALGSAYSSYAAGVNNRRIARYNANLARIHAFQARQRATWEADRIRERTAAVVGAQRAGFAGQGVVVGSGSTADVMASTEAIGAGDVQQAQMNGIMAAWGYEQQANEFTLRGDLEYRAGLSTAAGEVTTGAAQAEQFEYGMHH